MFFWSLCKVPVILVRFKLNPNFLEGFSKNTQISNLMKICLVGAELFLTDGRTDGRTDIQTDVMKSVVDFRNFANTPKTP